MFLTYLTIAFAPAAGILFLWIFLQFNSALEQKTKNMFYAMIGLEILEIFVYCAELYTASLTEPTLMRVILSAIGYSVRPILICMILQLSLREKGSLRKRTLLLIPIIINIIVAFSALFSDIAYTYNESNLFIRGPLGYTTHVVLIFYMVMILVCNIQNHKQKNKLETIIVFLIVILITVSLLIESIYNIRSIGRNAMVLSTIFYYMYFQSMHHIQLMDEETNIRKTWENIAKIDRLTGVLNKKAFLEELDQKFDRNGWKEGTALIFFDLDLFKEINDKLGHLIGDQALIDFAHKLEKVFSNSEYICRFGGDEFCVFVEEISESDLKTVLEVALLALRTEYKDDNVVHITVTTSIGVGYLPDGGSMETSQLLKLADTALYKAKENGRNQFVVHLGNNYDERI